LGYLIPNFLKKDASKNLKPPFIKIGEHKKRTPIITSLLLASILRIMHTKKKPIM
jgi:hypothetical protein